VYRPQLRAPERIAPVTVQKVDQRHPVIQHSPSVPVTRQGRAGFDTPAPTGVRRGQAEIPRTSPRQNLERPGFSAPSQALPPTSQSPTRSRQPDPRTEAAPRSYQAPPRAAQPAPMVPPTRTVPPARTPAQPRQTPPDRAQTAPPVSPVTAPTRPRNVEVPSASRNVERSTRTFAPPSESRSANSGGYYPKSYHQQKKCARPLTLPPGRHPAPLLPAGTPLRTPNPGKMILEVVGLLSALQPWALSTRGRGVNSESLVNRERNIVSYIVKG